MEGRHAADGVVGGGRGADFLRGGHGGWMSLGAVGSGYGGYGLGLFSNDGK